MVVFGGTGPGKRREGRGGRAPPLLPLVSTTLLLPAFVISFLQLDRLDNLTLFLVDAPAIIRRFMLPKY